MVSLQSPYSNATKREFLRLTSSSADGTEKQTNKQQKKKENSTRHYCCTWRGLLPIFIFTRERNKKATTLDEQDSCMLQCKSANTHVVEGEKGKERQRQRENKVYTPNQRLFVMVQNDDKVSRVRQRYGYVGTGSWIDDSKGV